MTSVSPTQSVHRAQGAGDDETPRHLASHDGSHGNTGDDNGARWASRTKASPVKIPPSMSSPVAVVSESTSGNDDGEGEPPKKHKTPLAWCRFIVNRPKTAFAITLCCNLSLLLLTMVLVVSGQSVFPTVFTELPLQLLDDDQWLRGLAWQARDANFTRYTHNVDSPSSTGGARSELSQPIVIMYEEPGGNVLSKTNLQAIRDLEDEFVSKPGYEDHCQLDESGDCVKPTSIIRFFDGTYAAVDAVFNDPNFDNVAAVLDAANTSPLLLNALQFHLGKDIAIDAAANIARSSITRSIIPFGGNVDAEFLTSTFHARLKRLFKDGYRGLDICYNAEAFWEQAVNDQVRYDLILVIGSFVFIFAFLWIQTRSLWISGFSVFAIMASFCGANLFYRYALDFRFFGIFHILSIFIILGIGADDVFVFMDTWRATAFEDYPGLEYRLSDTYRRASMTMLVTSLTTSIAFVVNGFSPLLGVNTFGIFSGILVMVNYVDIIVFLPTVVITHHNFWRDCVWCCCRPCLKPPSDSTEDLDRPLKKKGAIVRFFMGPYFRFVTHKIYRWLILLLFAVIVAVFTYFATRLGPQEEGVQVFKKGNNFVVFNDKERSAFVPSASDETTDVFIIWGLQNQDISRCHHTDYECSGDTVWDNSFDLNPLPSQKALQEFCQRLRNISDKENENLRVRRDMVTGELEINCFISSMYEYYENLNATGLPNGTDVSMPVSEIKMRSLMDANPGTFDASGLHDTFYRYFETGLGYWLTRGYSGRANDDNEDYDWLIGEEMDSRDTLPTVDNTDVYGTRLKYAAILVKTSLLYGTIGYETGITIINAWEDFVGAEMQTMPPSVANGFQCTCEGFNLWHWIKVQKSLADSAIRGIILGIVLAFPVLVIATQNIIIGAMATISIGLTTGCVIGVIPMAGWKLGLLESLNLSLIVGLAVDYVVHLAEGYHMSQKEDRLGRLRDMLEHVGVSVVSGAATTLGASMFMLFAEIQFFMQFGIFMFCTIGFSLIFSLGLFTTMLGIMGPQGQTGSLVVVYNWLVGRKKTDVECSKCDGRGFHGPGPIPAHAVSPINGHI